MSDSRRPPDSRRPAAPNAGSPLPDVEPGTESDDELQFPDAPMPDPPSVPWSGTVQHVEGRRFVNVTVRVDNICLMYARLRALREGTSVNAMLAAWVAAYSGKPYDPPPPRPPRMPRPRDIFDEQYRLRRRYGVRRPLDRF